MACAVCGGGGQRQCHPLFFVFIVTAGRNWNRTEMFFRFYKMLSA